MTIQVSQNELNSIRKYCILLEEIKLRINSVMEIIDERKNKEQNLNMEEMIQFHMKTEFICLQIRKILELIIFGTMVANQEVYKKTYSDFKNHWNVRKIMRKIEIINKNYYPIAMSFGDSKLNDDGINYTHELNVLNTEFLTKEEFIKLYDKCSEIIHSPNPFPGQSHYKDLPNNNCSRKDLFCEARILQRLTESFSSPLARIKFNAVLVSNALFAFSLRSRLF